MALNKSITDLTEYTSVLPYASELFGIYQPILGWKSKFSKRRFESGFLLDKKNILKTLPKYFIDKEKLNLNISEGDSPEIKISMGNLNPLVKELNSPNSIFLKKIGEEIEKYEGKTPKKGGEENKNKNFNLSEFLSEKNLKKIFETDVVPYYSKSYQTVYKNFNDFNSILAESEINLNDKKTSFVSNFQNQLKSKLKYESAIAGGLKYLFENKVEGLKLAELKNLTSGKIDNLEKVKDLFTLLCSTDALEEYLDKLDPTDRKELECVSLSPISIVHLFRQYFFELDSFLGTPSGHVWLSPGSNVELVEVNTRKTIIEKTTETMLEVFRKSDNSMTSSEELSEAVKEENQQNVHFGAGVEASYASITASADFSYDNSQKKAREAVHKQQRQQSQKLSSEIKKNFKSTYKTVEEKSDINSKKYLLANTTNELINYEMRRKMRQIGVQLQDVGTYLCWQAYVDDPGKDLGIAKLIHIAKSPELDNIPHPESIPLLQPIQEKKQIAIPYVQTSEDQGDKDEEYSDGEETDTDCNEGDSETIQSDFAMSFTPPQSGYKLTSVDLNPNGNSVTLSHSYIPPEGCDGSFNIHLDTVNFQGQDSITVELLLNWSPDPILNNEIEMKNKENLAKFTIKEKEAYEVAFIENAKERVKLMSKVQLRKSEELRDEERIVVYRKLIQDMLTRYIEIPDYRTRHKVSELINSIFDVDKMLYFVAPEWWRPRHNNFNQQLKENKTGSKTKPGNRVKFSGVDIQVGAKRNSKSDNNQYPELNSSVVSWGGLNESNRDNYFITEDSELARFGSSLGWLLQLDGDNLRNAFLNAPWVKAVIPVRPGKEKAAVSWLKATEGEDGFDKTFQIIVNDLIKKLDIRHSKELKKEKFSNADDLSDPELVDEGSTVTSTPIDRVYEHGFYPLKDGFKANDPEDFEIFDQWVEILPTDQIVPVPVKYDPKTGRMIQE